MRDGRPPDPAEARTEDNRGRPYWLVGIVLLGALVVVFGAALALDRTLRPSVGIERVAAPEDQGSTMAASPRAVTPPSPQRSPTGQMATDAETEAGAELPISAAVERAYLRYWDVYSTALSTLDVNRLPQAMAGDELADARRQVQDLRSQGRRATVDVQHDYVVVPLGETRATVHDRYRNRSYMVDARTGERVQSPGEGRIVEIAAQLELVDGTWKVTHIAQLVQ